MKTIIANYDSKTTTIFATSDSESYAIKLVTFKAKNICNVQNKSLKVINLTTIYLGLDKDQTSLVQYANEIFPVKNTVRPYIPESVKYKSMLKFRCD